MHIYLSSHVKNRFIDPAFCNTSTIFFNGFLSNFAESQPNLTQILWDFNIKNSQSDQTRQELISYLKIQLDFALHSDKNDLMIFIKTV